MKNLNIPLLCILFALAGCSSHHNSSGVDKLSAIRIVDRHDMVETVNSNDRLKQYQQTNFQSPQPYKQVVRVFRRDDEGRQKSILTSYHDNGNIKQYLEALSSRAHGKYCEWHNNGQLRIEARVIEGIAQLNEKARDTWLFDGECVVYDSEGRVEAKIRYDKGSLEGPSLYYYPTKVVSKKLNYKDNRLEGESHFFGEMGDLLGVTNYVRDEKHGAAYYLGSNDQPSFEEMYEYGKLKSGLYRDQEGAITYRIIDGSGMQPIYSGGQLDRVIEYRSGVPAGRVEVYNAKGDIESIYEAHAGKKHGEEWVYWNFSENLPKLLISWYQGEIHGIVKTWYDSGALESQKEMAHNTRQGIASAWYDNGDMMLIEEYENDQLVSGKYYKKGQRAPVSQLDKGTGIVTLHDQSGVFLRRVHLKKGQIVER